MTIKNKNISLIWSSFQAGDKEAFAFLYNQYIDVLYRYGSKLSNNKELVLDSIQEVFLDLYLKRERNKTNPENLKYYLILALKRNIIKKLKKNKKIVWDESSKNDNFFEPVYSVERSIIEEESHNEISSKILKALNKLPAKQKEALYLRFNEALEYPEIAKLLGISVESVRKQVYRAIKTMRETFNKVTLVLFSLASFQE